MIDGSVQWDTPLLQLLREDRNVKQPPNLNLETLMENSENFQRKFPIDSVRCKTLISKVKTKVLEENCNSAYPVVYEKILRLYGDFILYKRQFGTPIEKEVYNKLTILGLVDRLLLKRALIFGSADHYILVDGTEGFGWSQIGTEEETEELKLQNCISYDEIKLSVFLSVSSYTYFINDGSRRNFGKPVRFRHNLQKEGVIVGLTGTRMTRRGVMEYQDIVISKEQNIVDNGYGNASAPTIKSFFAKFYGQAPLTYEQLLELKPNESERFTKFNKGDYFDNECFAKRISYSFDTLLLEANARARSRGIFAFVHVVGIGLGVWKCAPHQDEIFMQTFAKRIETLGKKLDSVSDIFFAYINCGSVGIYEHGSIIPIDGHPKGGIKVHIGKREPHVKLSGKDKGKLLVVSFAWDGNSLPGNEFWTGSLHSSSDPAAASSTQIAELLNAHINPKISAANLHIATLEGVLPFQEYCESVLKDKTN